MPLYISCPPSPHICIIMLADRLQHISLESALKDLAMKKYRSYNFVEEVFMRSQKGYETCSSCLNNLDCHNRGSLSNLLMCKAKQQKIILRK